MTQPLLRGAGRDVVLAQLDAARANRTTTALTRDRSASQLLLDALTAYWSSIMRAAHSTSSGAALASRASSAKRAPRA